MTLRQAAWSRLPFNSRLYSNFTQFVL